MRSVIGSWGLCQWWGEDNRLIHPDDYDRLQQLVTPGKVCQCVGEDAGYLVLRYKSGRYRVNPSLFQSVPAPAKSFGESVSLKKGGQIISARICDIYWHFKRDQAYFFVCVNDKRLKKRYWRDDFLNGAASPIQDGSQ